MYLFIHEQRDCNYKIVIGGHKIGKNLEVGNGLENEKHVKDDNYFKT